MGCPNLKLKRQAHWLRYIHSRNVHDVNCMTSSCRTTKHPEFPELAPEGHSTTTSYYTPTSLNPENALLEGPWVAKLASVLVPTVLPKYSAITLYEALHNSFRGHFPAPLRATFTSGHCPSRWGEILCILIKQFSHMHFVLSRVLWKTTLIVQKINNNMHFCIQGVVT